MYGIFFTEPARKKLKKLERSMQLRIISCLERIRIRPERYVKKLVNYPYYRLRVGEYRVILDIQKDKLIILVITLGHRKSIYK